MKLSKDTSMVDLKVFLAQLNHFFRRVALLCFSKKGPTEQKIQFNSSHQGFLNNFFDYLYHKLHELLSVTMVQKMICLQNKQYGVD